MPISEFFSVIGPIYGYVTMQLVLGIIAHRASIPFNELTFTCPKSLQIFWHKTKLVLRYVFLWCSLGLFKIDVKAVPSKQKKYNAFTLGGAFVFYFFATSAIADGIIRGQDSLSVALFVKSGLVWAILIGLVVGTSLFCVKFLKYGHDARLAGFIGIRPIAWIAMAIITRLWGNEGLVFFTVILVTEETVGCILWFKVINCRHNLIVAIAKNPPTWACVIAFTCVCCGVIESHAIVQFFASWCVCLSLFFVGAEVSKAIYHYRPADKQNIMLGAFLRLIVAPIASLVAIGIVALAAYLLGIACTFHPAHVGSFMIYLGVFGSAVAHYILWLASKNPIDDVQVYCNSLVVSFFVCPFTLLGFLYLFLSFYPM